MPENIFKRIFEPLVRVGGTIITEPKGNAYKVVYIEQTGIIEHDFGSIGANSTIYDQVIDSIAMHKNELGQFRMFFVDNIVLENIRLPLGAGRFVLKNKTGFIDNTFQSTALGLDYFSQFTEIYVFEDNVPVVNVRNPSSTALTNSRIRFFGYKYVLRPTTELVEPIVRVPTEGLALLK